MTEKNIYQEKGYVNRKDYLKCMSEDYGVPLETVYALADLLGKDEDFDGLISSLEDAEEMNWD
jgi:hypothetical protein